MFLLQNHRPLSLVRTDLINLYDVLVDEIKIRILESDCSTTERCTYQKLLQNLHEAGIKVSTTRAQFLKKEILEKSKSYKISVGSKRKQLHRKTKNQLLPKQGQILSWRQQDNVELPKQFKTESSRKIDDVAEKWKARIAAAEKQNDVLYQEEENCDRENSDHENSDHENNDHENSDDDEDVALLKQIFEASAKVSADLKHRHESVQNEKETRKKVDGKDSQTTKFLKKQSLYKSRTSPTQSKAELRFPSDNITSLATGIGNIYLDPKETKQYKRKHRIKLRTSDVEAKEDSPQHNDYDEIYYSSKNSEGEKVSVKVGNQSESMNKSKQRKFDNERQQTKSKQKMEWRESYRTRNHDAAKGYSSREISNKMLKLDLNKNCEQLGSGESEDGFAEDVRSYRKTKKGNPSSDTKEVSDSDSNEYSDKSEHFYEQNRRRDALDKKYILKHEKNYEYKTNKRTSDVEHSTDKYDTGRRMLRKNNYDSDNDDLKNNVRGKISYKNEKDYFREVKEKSKGRTKNDSSENLEELLKEVVRDTVHFKPRTIKF